jgi:hypothetical protein
MERHGRVDQDPAIRKLSDAAEGCSIWRGARGGHADPASGFNDPLAAILSRRRRTVKFGCAQRVLCDIASQMAHISQ